MLPATFNVATLGIKRENKSIALSIQAAFHSFEDCFASKL